MKLNKIISKTLLRLASSSTKLARSIDRNHFQSARLRWYEDKGDQTLRLDYSLSDNSVVFDLGGYEGQWSSDIYSRYRCKIHIFEPVKAFADSIKTRFSKNPDIKVYQCGLSNKTQSLEISLSMNASSLFNAHLAPSPTERISLLKASDFFSEHKISKIDLMKINIEGGEYDLLDHLISSGFIKNIENVQIQFHAFVPDAEQRMKKIKEQLTLTHHSTYQYHFIWENWKRKQ